MELSRLRARVVTNVKPVRGDLLELVGRRLLEFFGEGLQELIVEFLQELVGEKLLEFFGEGLKELIVEFLQELVGVWRGFTMGLKQRFLASLEGIQEGFC